MTLLEDEREVILNGVEFLEHLSKEPVDYLGFCGTAYWGNKILCVGGWYPVNPSTMQLFIIPDAEMLRKHPSVFARTTIKWRKKVEAFIFPRIQAVALPGLSNWMRVIGFEFEHVIENYNGTGKTYEMWGRTL